MRFDICSCLLVWAICIGLMSCEFSSNTETIQKGYNVNMDVLKNKDSQFQGYVIQKTDTTNIEFLDKSTNKKGVYSILLKNSNYVRQITPIQFFVLSNEKNVCKIIWHQVEYIRGERTDVYLKKRLKKGLYEVRIGYILRKEYYSDAMPIFYCDSFILKID